MADNREECSNDKTLQNLTCSLQIYWGCAYLCRKSSEGTSLDYLLVISYNNSFQWPFMFCRTVFMHWEYCLSVLPSDVLLLQLEKDLSFLLWLLLILT